MLSTGVMITLIICATIVILSIGAIINTTIKVRAMQDFKEEVVESIVDWMLESGIVEDDEDYDDLPGMDWRND